jgi:hypothetical protein
MATSLKRRALSRRRIAGLCLPRAAASASPIALSLGCAYAENSGDWPTGDAFPSVTADASPSSAPLADGAPSALQDATAPSDDAATSATNPVDGAAASNPPSSPRSDAQSSATPLNSPAT